MQQTKRSTTNFGRRTLLITALNIAHVEVALALGLAFTRATRSDKLVI